VVSIRHIEHDFSGSLPQGRSRKNPRNRRLSGLPTGQTLGNFDFAFQPSVERSRIETLATCAWIRERESLLLQGPPGVGKSHLAVGIVGEVVEHMRRTPGVIYGITTDGSKGPVYRGRARAGGSELFEENPWRRRLVGGEN